MSRLIGTQQEINQLMVSLGETLERIKETTAGQSPAVLNRVPGSKEWSAVDILAHLRACADLWTYSIYAMLSIDHPELQEIHPRQWQRVLGYANLDFYKSYEAFHIQRQQLLSILKTLPVDGWQRSALIGSRKHTIYSQARRLDQHEQNHCQQIERLFLGNGE